MNRLPDRPNLGHLKKQAKDLIRAYRRRDPGAIARFRDALPAPPAERRGDRVARLAPARRAILHRPRVRLRVMGRSQPLRRSAIGWPRRSRGACPALVPAGVFGRHCGNRKSCQSARSPSACWPRSRILVADDRVSRLRDRRRGDAAAGGARRPGLGQSSGRAAEPAAARRGHAFEPAAGAGVPASACIDSARFLLSAGADPNQQVGNRWPPASLEKPDDGNPVSALYGAAGQSSRSRADAIAARGRRRSQRR